ncbi:MAG: XdhC/CoxF family protein, partial [bacterium]|nr:XdhC/CoxF family protein [bacterium]
IAGICDFNVTIVDDRSEFASTKRFPNVDKVVCGEYIRSFAGLDINDKTFIVIVTRGHAFDEVVLEQAVQTAAGYIGMIGSKKKIRTLYQHLQNRGFDAGSLKNVFAPIGIDIGARTPETIAVSIMAEIIKFREMNNDNPAMHLKEAMKFYFNGS